MKILRIELDNITSHHHSEIKFENGVNILTGLNGSGKSTTLKMIGFVLFDYLPSRDHQIFVRNINPSSKSGIVRVFIQGKDEKTFVVERKFGGTSKFTVYEIKGTEFTESSATILLSDRAGIMKWLQTQFELDENYELKAIFENAVGVEQGTFTAPFLISREADRKAVFGPMLNVEIYEKIYENFRPINSSLEDSLHSLKSTISNLEGKCSKKQELLDEKSEIDKNMASKEAKLKELQQTQTSFRLEFDALDHVKNDLERIKKQEAGLVEKVNGLKKLIEQGQKSLKEAENAAAICQNSKPAYEKYLVLEAQEKVLSKKKKDLEAYTKKKGEVQNEITRLTTLIKSQEEEILRIENERQEQPVLLEKKAAYEQLTKELDLIKSQLSQIQTKKHDLKKKEKDLNNRQSLHAGLLQEMKDFERISEKVASIENLQEKYNFTSKEIAELEAKLKSARENGEQAKGGLCPFLGEKCKNIKEDNLETYFLKKVEELAPLIQASNQSLKKIKKDLDDAKNYRSKLDELNKKKGSIEGLTNEIEQIKVDISDISKFVAGEKKLVDNIGENTKVLDDYRVFLERLAVIESDIKKAKQIQKELQSFKTILQDNSGNAAKIETEITKLASIPQELEMVVEEKAANRDAYIAYTSNIKIAQNLQKFSAEIKESKALYDRTVLNYNEIKKALEILLSQFKVEKYQVLSQKIEEISGQISAVGAELQENAKRIRQLSGELAEIAQFETEILTFQNQLKRKEDIKGFVKNIRDWYRSAGPKIAKALLGSINYRATVIFRDLTGMVEVEIEWQEDFTAVLKDHGENPSDREFRQLSGGEQMAVALSIRLALLQSLSKLDFAFFDEPTVNLDELKRAKLAETIKHIKGFRQFFVISHDNTFEDDAHHVIHFSKENNETKISYN